MEAQHLVAVVEAVMTVSSESNDRFFIIVVRLSSSTLGRARLGSRPRVRRENDMERSAEVFRRAAAQIVSFARYCCAGGRFF